MRKIILVLAALLGAIGLLWGNLYLKTKSTADDMVAKLRPVAAVSYEGVSVSLLDSSVGIVGLRFRPHGGPGEVAAEAFRLRAPDLITLLSGQSDVEADRIPEGLEILMEGVALGSDALVDQMWRTNRPPGPLDAVFAGSCAGGAPFGAEDLDYIGLDRLVFDSSLGFDRDADAGTITVRFTWRLRGMMGYSGSATFATHASTFQEIFAAGEVPGLRRAQVTVSDSGYYHAVNEYCAYDAGVELAAYVDRQVAAGDRALRALGVDPAPDLMAAYRRLISDGGEVRIELRPATPVDITTLHLYSPKSVTRQLRPRVELDGATLDIAALEGQPATASAPDPAWLATLEAEKKEPSVPLGRAEFRETPLADLGDYRGYQVKIQLHSGERHEGILRGVTGDGLQLERRVHGGSVSYGVAPETIRRVDVLRVERRGDAAESAAQ